MNECHNVYLYGFAIFVYSIAVKSTYYRSYTYNTWPGNIWLDGGKIAISQKKLNKSLSCPQFRSIYCYSWKLSLAVSTKSVLYLYVWLSHNGKLIRSNTRLISDERHTTQTPPPRLPLYPPISIILPESLTLAVALPFYLTPSTVLLFLLCCIFVICSSYRLASYQYRNYITVG